MSVSTAQRRRQILNRIESTPGVNLRQVQRYTGLPLSAVSRILDELEDEGKVESTLEMHYRRFFPVGKGLHKRERRVLAFVNKPRPRAILEYLVDNPGTRHTELAIGVGVQQPILTYYMKQILAADVVTVKQEGVERFYRVKNPQMVRRALDRTAKGFDKVLAKG